MNSLAWPRGNLYDNLTQLHFNALLVEIRPEGGR
jgi:hypothetical protein